MTHPLALPGSYPTGVRHAAAYTTLNPINSTEHTYRLLYIDDDESKYQKEYFLGLPAFLPLPEVLQKMIDSKPYAFTGIIAVSLENLSLKNGLPIPF